MIKRPLYLDILKTYQDVHLVKILAGVRRCGKSTILKMFLEELLQQGIDQDHIIHISYSTDFMTREILPETMYRTITEHIKDNKTYYLFLDEVQEVTGWEKVINALLEKFPTDIYITGSNSKLMASEIATYLTGRYVSIPIYPLSFQEYLNFKKESQVPRQEQLLNYIKFGGFPLIANNNFDATTAYQIIEGIYTSVVGRDIVQRHTITQPELFQRVVKYVFENVGKTFSANAIVNFLKNEGRSLSVEIVYNYLKWLEEAFIIYRCPRYDLQGKAVLKTQEKFFLADSSLKYSLLGYNPESLAAMLENVVFLELKRRGYAVYVGKNGTKEVDFIAKRRDELIYVQVCRTLPLTSDREVANLLSINDHYHKYVVTLDAWEVGNIQGIKIMQLDAFLLCGEL